MVYEAVMSRREASSCPSRRTAARIAGGEDCQILAVGRGTARDVAEAVRYLRRAVAAMHELALREPDETLRRMEAAARVPAKVNARVGLAQMLANGTGGPKDPKRAMALLEAAAALPWENRNARF
jgi:TPR repeat protein